MRLERLKSAVARDVPETGECVVLDQAQGRIIALNAMGAAVWDLLDGTRDEAAVVETLAAATGEPREAVSRDVAALLERLKNEGFLEAGPGEPASGLTS